MGKEKTTDWEPYAAAIPLAITGSWAMAAAIFEILIIWPALVSFIMASLGVLTWMRISISKRLTEQKEHSKALLDQVTALSAHVMQGTRLNSVDDLFRCLCDARIRTKSNIRLMKIRGRTPVKIENNQVVLDEHGSRKGLPVYTSDSEAQAEWYDELPAWAAENGHQLERITVLDGDMSVYADFINRQMKSAGATWTAYGLKERVAGLPAYNLCIFDDRELTITFGNPNTGGSTSIWLNEQGIGSFFVKLYDSIKTQNADPVKAS